MTPSTVRCATYETALVARALDAPAGADLDSHLATCPSCRRKLNAYRQMRAGLLCGPFAMPGKHIAVRLMRLLTRALPNRMVRSLHLLLH